MKTFKTFLTQLDETLTPKQRKWIDNKLWRIGSKHDWLFKEPSLHAEGAIKIDDNTFTIPLSSVDKTRENEIRDHLSKHGYTIHDYVNDHIIDRHGRTTSIGKALGRTEKDPNLYATDPRVRARQNGELEDNDHEIVISRDPYHVGGMSTDRNWSSCMSLPGDNDRYSGGMYHRKVAHDLQQGTLVAYLTKKGTIKPNTELTKDEALSRILLKKYEGGSGKNIFRADPHSYSAPAYSGHSVAREKYPQFEKAVKDFGERIWKADDNDIYSIHPNLYPDGSPSTILPKNRDEWSPKLLHNYARHIDNLEDRYENYEIKPDSQTNLHALRMEIAEHPNTSSETLEHILPSTNEDSYDRYDDKYHNHAIYGRGTSPKAELTNAIANHKNVSVDTLHDIISNSNSEDLDDVDELRTKLLTHQDADDSILADHKGFSDEHDLMIAKHPNVSQTTLSDLYDDHSNTLKNGYYNNSEGEHPEKIIKTIAAKTEWPSVHEQILDDIKDNGYHDDLKHELLSTIAKHSNNANILHRTMLLADPNHSSHHAIQRIITKNPNTETNTLEHVTNNLSKQYPNEITKVIAPITDKYTHESNNYNQGNFHYMPQTKSWIRVHKDRGDLIESPVLPKFQRMLNKEHKDKINQVNNEHENNIRKTQEKILTNVAKHKNTSMLMAQDLANHENPVINTIAKDRLEKNRFNKMI